MSKNDIDKLVKKLEDVFSDKEYVYSCLLLTSEKYRSREPGKFLYEMAMKTLPKNRFSRQYIELVYTTLKAWGMNSRRARLSSFEEFERSIIRNKSILFRLESKNIKKLNDDDIKKLEHLFYDMKLTDTKTALVTFSKTMHFFLPNLIVPIDGQYTLTFFGKKNHNSFDDEAKEFSVFANIEKAYSIFANKHNLKECLNGGWNQNVPKILDNLVIGYTLKNKEA